MVKLASVISKTTNIAELTLDGANIFKSSLFDIIGDSVSFKKSSIKGVVSEVKLQVDHTNFIQVKAVNTDELLDSSFVIEDFSIDNFKSTVAPDISAQLFNF